MRLLIAASSLLFLASPGTASQDKDKVPVATPTGKSVDCIQLNQIRDTKVRDDKTIDFFMNGKKVYRNTLDGSCPQLASEKRFSYRVSLDQLCSLDTITVLLDPGMGRGASCGLGQFQPVTLAAGH